MITSKNKDQHFFDKHNKVQKDDTVASEKF